MKRSDFILAINGIFALAFCIYCNNEKMQSQLICMGLAFIIVALAKICAQLEDNRRG